MGSIVPFLFDAEEKRIFGVCQYFYQLLQQKCYTAHLTNCRQLVLFCSDKPDSYFPHKYQSGHLYCEGQPFLSVVIYWLVVRLDQ